MTNQRILEQAYRKITDYITENEKDNSEVIQFFPPQELKEKVPIEIEEVGVSEDTFLKLIDMYLTYSVRTGKKQFLNQLYSGFNFPAFLGEVFSALTNTSMYTYEVAPLATLIEVEMIKLLQGFAGYTNGDGIFLTGGSNANLIAMFSARNKVLPESRFEGYDNSQKLVAFINEKAHYSFETASNLLGIGSKNVIKVKTDKNNRMIPKELEREIEEAKARGEKPFFVVATCATTLTGAFDPIDEMATICEKHSIWLHADGAFGGSLIMSEKNKHLFRGIERTDSFTWNPHKLMNIPLICSTILVKERGTLQRNLTDINTDYIFHDIEEIEDLGKKSIQCGRKVDAVKLWFALKYYGLKGYAQRMDNLVLVAKHAEHIVKQHPKMELLAERQSVAVCFRYRPDKELIDLNDFNLQVRENLRKSGKTIVNYGYLGEELTIRLVITNGEITKGDISKFFNYFVEEAEKLEKVYEK